MEKNSNELVLPVFPNLPQSASLKRVAEKLWEHEDVAAIWLGGSFARGEADLYSDVDLRVALYPGAKERWVDLDQSRLSDLFGTEVVGCMPLSFGDALLFHLVLANGEIYDLWIQTTEQAPSQEESVVLGCRDDEFARKLKEIKPSDYLKPTVADADAVQKLLASFWINTIKHSKVLHRELDMVAQNGITMERSLIVRLWYILATGSDPTVARPTIHTLTDLDRVVTSSIGQRCLPFTGGPMTSRAEILQAIESNRKEVERVGRTLADRLGFEYPEALERTARQSWQLYLDGLS